MKYLLMLACIFGYNANLIAQIEHPVTWAYAAKKVNSKEAIIFLQATIATNWHV